MGLLDLLGLGGNAQGGGLGIGDRIDATYNHPLYEAQHQRAQEQALQAAMAQRGGVTPEMAHAFGMSPQYMQQFGQAFMPQVPQVHWSPNQEGGESPYTSNVNGQNASISQMGINPPGTSPNPVQATSPGPMQGGTQQLPVGTSQPTPATPTKLPTSTSQISGGIADQAKALRAAGKSEEEIIALLPSNLRPYIADVLNDKADLDTLPQRDPRSPPKGFLKEIIHAIRPGWDERAAKGRQIFINQYDSTKMSDLGGQIKMAGATAGHIADAAEGLGNLHNLGPGSGSLGVTNKGDVTGLTSLLPEGLAGTPEGGKEDQYGAQTINEFKNKWHPGEVNEVKRLGTFGAGELDKWASGGSPTNAKQAEYERAFDTNASPKAQAGSLRGLVKIMKDQLKGIEGQRDLVFRTNPGRAKDFPVSIPEYEQNLARMEAQIAKLDPEGPEAQALKQGNASTPPPTQTERGGWSNFRVGK